LEATLPRFGAVEHLHRLRSDAGLDGIVATSPLTTQFVTGCLILTQRLLPDRLAVVVSGPDADAFVVCDMEERQARNESAIRDVRSYTEFVTSPMEFAAAVVREFGVEGRLGYESRHLPAHHYLELRRALPEAELVPIDEEVGRMRSVKSKHEVDLLRDAFQLTDRAIAHGYETAERGESTRTIVGRMKRMLADGGADETAFAVIGAGTSTLSGHPEADDRAVQDGEAVRVDFGGRFGGYHSDLARTAFMGEAGREERDTYRRLWASLEAVVAAVRPGVEARDVHRAGYRAMLDNGLVPNTANGAWEMAHVGHGIGLEIHEFPLLAPTEPAALVPNMVLCVELIHTEPGRFRMHVEDSVLVTENGAEVLSRSRDWNDLPIIAERQ
jgi:Xaa-Pro aminopeptidase